MAGAARSQIEGFLSSFSTFLFRPRRSFFGHTDIIRYEFLLNGDNVSGQWGALVEAA
jgi:hypothetical protein